MSNTDSAMNPLEGAQFSIGAASRMSGIPEATLRVWERRYQFPQSARSPGGHRQYSQQDVLQLRWVKMQMDAGKRASGAIRARLFIRRDAAVANDLRAPLPPDDAPDPATHGAHVRLLNSLLAYDAAQATAHLEHCVLRYPVPRVVLDIVGPTLAAIGVAWAKGEVDVAAEHFATNFLRHQLLKWMQASPTPYLVQPVALACAPGELHEGSLLMLGVLLRQLRWPVLYLGQTLPLADMGAFIEQARPAMIVFVAMSEAPARALAEWPRWLRKSAELEPPLIGFGGRAFIEQPALAQSVPGALLGSTLSEGAERIDRIMLHLAVLDR